MGTEDDEHFVGSVLDGTALPLVSNSSTGFQNNTEKCWSYSGGS